MTTFISFLTDEQLSRFARIDAQLQSLGFEVISEPENAEQADAWLRGLTGALQKIEKQFMLTNERYGTRGFSKKARAIVTSDRAFEPGFGVRVAQ